MPVKAATRSQVYRERHHSETFLEKDRQRKRKERSKARAKAKAKGKTTIKAWPDNPGQAVIDWSERALVIPPGHRSEGKPMKLPPYLADPIRALDSFAEVSVLISRKIANDWAYYPCLGIFGWTHCTTWFRCGLCKPLS